MDNKFINIYRALHTETQKVHFFVGRYDEGTEKYIALSQNTNRKHVIGSHAEFSTFAEAVQYKGYDDYDVAAQSALNKYTWSKIKQGAWDKNLGEGYEPWAPGRRGRRRE